MVQEAGLWRRDRIRQDKATEPYVVRPVGRKVIARKPRFCWVVSKEDGRLVRVWR